MYAELYEYLILHRQLHLPGIGTFLLETKPSVTDLSYRQMNAPVYSVSLSPAAAQPSKRLFHWLAERLGIGYNEAIMRFNNFAFDLRSKIMSGQKVVWTRVGTLSKWVNDEIKFEPSLKDRSLDPPVSATKIIRDKAEHTIRVGEEERTSAEMTELLTEAEPGHSRWWLPGLLAAIVLAMVLLFYFSQHGFSPRSAGNQQELQPGKARPTYQTIP